MARGCFADRQWQKRGKMSENRVTSSRTLSKKVRNWICLCQPHSGCCYQAFRHSIWILVMNLWRCWVARNEVSIEGTECRENSAGTKHRFMST